MEQTNSKLGQHEPERLVSINRVFDAPRAMVFQAWTDAEQLLKWFAPQGCSISFKSIDIRPGGEFHSCIRTEDGYECWCKGIYLVVKSPEQLVFSMSNVDQAGNLIDPVTIGMDPDWPSETIVTVTLTDIGGRTKMSLRQTVSESVAQRTGALPSWLDMFNRLECLLGISNDDSPLRVGQPQEMVS